MRSLIVLVFLLWSAAARAQFTIPDRPIAIVWQQTIEATSPAGRLTVYPVPLYGAGDDVVVAAIEQIDRTANGPVRGWIERRGPAGVQWRYELPDLPPGTDLETAMAPPDAAGRALLAVTFQTEKPPMNGEYGRVLSIDLNTGAVDKVIALRYPRIAAHGKPNIDDRLHVDGALRLESGEIAVFGGDNPGPYRWWAGLRDKDGGFLWDTGAPSRGYGETRAARETADGGIELLVDAIAFTKDFRDRHLLIRLDHSGQILSTVDLAPLSNTQIDFLGSDGLLTVTKTDGHNFVSMRDANSARQGSALLPATARFAGQAGPWLIFNDIAGQHWFVSADGQRLGFPDGIAGPIADGRYGIDAHGRPVKYILVQKCLDQVNRFDCKHYQLSLARIDF